MYILWKKLYNDQQYNTVTNFLLRNVLLFFTLSFSLKSESKVILMAFLTLICFQLMHEMIKIAS